MRKGVKLGKCPECHKKGLIKHTSRIYVFANCRYCDHYVKPGKRWVVGQGWIPIKGREKEQIILGNI